jgi:sulfonate transport system substrate-binding protein
MLQAMGAGSVDIGAVGDAPPIFAAAGGEKIAVVGATVANPDGTALLVPKGSAVHSVAQLKGKKIAVAEGSSSNYHLVAVLKQAGLSVHDVTIENLQPPQAAAAFASGHVDAWDVWSPFTEQAEGQHGARVLVNGSAIGKTYSFEVASRAALADPAKSAAIRAYSRRRARGRRGAVWLTAGGPGRGRAATPGAGPGQARRYGRPDGSASAMSAGRYSTVTGR